MNTVIHACLRAHTFTNTRRHTYMHPCIHACTPLACPSQQHIGCLSGFKLLASQKQCNAFFRLFYTTSCLNSGLWTSRSHYIWSKTTSHTKASKPSRQLERHQDSYFWIEATIYWRIRREKRFGIIRLPESFFTAVISRSERAPQIRFRFVTRMRARDFRLSCDPM